MMSYIEVKALYYLIDVKNYTLDDLSKIKEEHILSYLFDKGYYEEFRDWDKR